jgi:hypothetical protein
MVGLPTAKTRLAPAAAVLLTSSSPAFAQSAAHGPPIWMWPAIGITGLLVIIWVLSLFVRNDPRVEAQMRREAGDTPNIIPLHDDDGGHHHFH